MKLIKILILMGFFSSLFGCKSDNTKKSVVEIDGKEIPIIESENPMSSDYGLQDLSDKQKAEFNTILNNAEIFILKYSDKEEFLNAENLDYVLEQWKLDKSTTKSDKNDVVEMLGCAFGQDLINSLNCEWQILTDEYGTDFTVIHKKYKINGFPFSSVLKAIEEDRKESLNGIKLILKKNIEDAKSGAEYDERK